MPDAKKVAYLFGAGATHAEIQNLEPSPSETFFYKNGLLISNVSQRVIKSAQKARGFKKNVEFVTSTEGSLNIELLLSLLELNRIPGAESKVKTLHKLIRGDIEKILSKRKKNRFYLHKAFFELHSSIKEEEELLGVISLNYDDVLDEAYMRLKLNGESPPNYCHTSKKGPGVPLLKLHGSFNWDNIKTTRKSKPVSIVPLGINKNYLIPPYNFIWSRSFEVLSQCDILRIIGCALSQNDIGLIDLLFKAHLERDESFEIQIVDFEETADEIKNNYGFFPGIVKPHEIEGTLIADELISKERNVGNPFKIWLKAKGIRMLGDRINQTRFLKKCL